jgi:hypothetical protein
VSKIVARGAGAERLYEVAQAHAPQYYTLKGAGDLDGAIVTFGPSVTEIAPVTKKRGRPVTGNAKSNAERQKAFRQRKRAA